MIDHIYMVDRIEGSSVTIIDDAGDRVHFPVSPFPEGIREGLILRVPIEDGTPQWGSAMIDTRETERRIHLARAWVLGLERRDLGADAKPRA